MGSEPPLPSTVFAREDSEHLSSDALAVALDSLLESHPDAPVAALRSDGIIVAMPDSVPLRENPVLEGRAGMDLIAVDEESMAGWERLLKRGAALYRVHPAGRPQASWTIYGLDLREGHGVIFMLTVPEPAGAGGHPADVSSVADFAPMPPRCATLRKDELAFIRAVDDATLQLLGWGADDLVDRRSLEFIHPDDQALARDAWMEMLAKPGPGRRVRLRHACSDGSWLWLEVSNHNLLGDPGHACVVCEMVDISEEMAAHELLHRLAEAVPVGLLQLDRAGRVVYSNDRLHEILGVPRRQSVAEQMASVLPAHQQLLSAAVERALGEAEPSDFEIELRHSGSGATRFCTVGLRPLGDQPDALGGVIACIADVTESMRMREELRRRSMYDELTSCLNRATVVAALQEQILGGGESTARAVMFLDLDCFKPVNDAYGHAAGDQLLREISARLRASLRAPDLIGRMGGDEFLIVCPDVDSREDAEVLAERIAGVQHAPIDLGPASVQPRVSIGIAWSRGAGLSAEGLVARADEAMYSSKEEGAGRPKFAGASPSSVGRARAGRVARRAGSPQAA